MTDSADSELWRQQVHTEGSVVLTPDPRVLDALGGNHLLETAVADLVDNSIDAGAGNIILRFVSNRGRLESFYVIDDGQGIKGLDAAMTAGAPREYRPSELGHFGVGLKAASFSQADSLTVVTRTPNGPAAGRRWLADKARRESECDIVHPSFCRQEMARAAASTNSAIGTVVRWDEIRAFPTGRNREDVDRYLDDTIGRLRRHLGCVFHRFLEREELTITIEVESAESSSAGPSSTVKPINPFRYLRPGSAGYPVAMSTRIADTTLEFTCHVWPPRSSLIEYTLGEKDVFGHQGIYFFRRDRLLQRGGWNNVEVQAKDLQLARVSVDLPDDLVHRQLARMNPEKSRVEMTSELASAFHMARSAAGGNFESFLSAARETYKTSNKRQSSRAKVVPVGKGLPPSVRRSFEEETGFLPGYDAVDIRWRRLDGDTFFEVDRQASVLWINDKYRSALNGNERGSLNDAPLIKTLVYLLVENLFQGSHWGTKDKDNLDLWQSLLAQAARQHLT